jgi:PAS domain S-box-containing protein
MEELKASILIVDDTPANLRLLIQMLKSQNYRARAVTSGPQALAAVQSNPPDLILLDIMMPKMNGYEVAARLKKDPDLEDVPIIFISALNDTESKIKAFEAGGADYVTKPLQSEEVLARVQTHLQLRHELRERQRLIQELDTLNRQLQQEITQRKAAQEAREASLQLLRRALERTEALHTIARSLIVKRDLDDMLQSVADNLVKALACSRVIVMTLDIERECITRLVKSGPDADLVVEPAYSDLMEGLPGWAVKNLQPILSTKHHPDPRESHRARELRRKSEGGSMIVVPLHYQGHTLGTLVAINKPDQDDFEKSDVALLGAVAGQVAIILTNIQLAEETSRLKEFNEGIVQGVAEAILITDPEETVTFANPAVGDMLGYRAESLIGKKMDEMMPKPEPPSKERDYVRAKVVKRRAERTYQYEAKLLNDAGVPVPVLASARPLFRDGTFTGTLTAFTDISDLKEAEAALRQFAEDLQKQNAELDAFSHTVAHDLKGPLSTMIGFADILQDDLDELPETFGYFINHIIQTSFKMSAIIDELLLLASVRSVEQIDVAIVDMAAVVAKAERRWRYLLEDGTINAHVIIPESWPGVLGYGPWLEEVWVNYVTNAIKYGTGPDDREPSQIELGFGWHNHHAAAAPPVADGSDPTVISETPVQDGYVRFWVRDQGPGLSPKQQRQLFTPFERLHNVRASGHGLGLSIVRRIIEKLGGQVGVESAPGTGSTFYFTLPVARTSVTCRQA